MHTQVLECPALMSKERLALGEEEGSQLCRIKGRGRLRRSSSRAAAFRAPCGFVTVHRSTGDAAKRPR